MAPPAVNDDDPFDEEREIAAPAASDAAETKTAQNSNALACQKCGKALTKSQQELSIRNYGTAMCPHCQKDNKDNKVRETAAAN